MRIHWFLGLGMIACAGAPAPPASPASASSPPAPTPVAAAPVRAPSSDPELAVEVPPPPPECASFRAAPTGCASGALEPSLASALERTDVIARDQGLVCVERNHPELAPALRALRAELAPTACGDVLVTPLLESDAAATNPDDENTLLGLLVAARLSRLVGTPPALAPPFDKPRFLEFFEQKLKPWMIQQARAVGQLSLSASRLKGYGRALAAIEAALSDLRFVQAVRQVPLPEELSQDVDAKNVYYAALDEALEPRKTRGRDAALIGLRFFAELGALRDSRVLRARALLSELYSGSRIDALDRLLLPEPTPLSRVSDAERLAASLPTYYAERLRGALPTLRGVPVLRASLEQGLSPTLRAELDRETLDEQGKVTYALFEARRGALYFSGTAYARAAEILGPDGTSSASRLLYGVSRALSNAPKHAGDLMLGTPAPRAPLGDVTALDVLAKSKDPLSAEAEFDAAYIRSLTPGNDAKFWDDLAVRFGSAARRLKAGDGRKLAAELADSARQTARALRAPR